MMICRFPPGREQSGGLGEEEEEQKRKEKRGEIPNSAQSRAFSVGVSILMGTSCNETVSIFHFQD